MKKMLAATALALFGLAPAIGSACEYSASMASTATPSPLALTPVPAATKVPKATVVKAPAPKTGKQALGKMAKSAPDAKLAVASAN